MPPLLPGFEHRDKDILAFWVHIEASSANDNNPRFEVSHWKLRHDDCVRNLVKRDEATSSAHPQCEEEGLRCNPSSSGVLIAAEEIGEGLGCGEPVSPPPATTLHLQPTLNQGHMTCCVQMHQTFPNCVTRCTKPFRTVVTCTSKVSSDVPPMTTSDFRPTAV